MELSTPQIVERGGSVRVQSHVESISGPELLWFEFDSAFARFLCPERVDGFLLASLLMAMERGERELIVRGAVSERLLHNVKRQLIPIWRTLDPALSAVSIKVDETRSCAEPSERAVATGFSAGVDSFCTLADYLDPADTPGYRLTHFVFCNVGNHGCGEGGRRLFADRWQLLKDFPEQLGRTFVRIDSNLDDLVKKSFAQTHQARNASAVLLLPRLFAKYLYSSGYGFDQCYFREAVDICHADPAAVQLFSTEGLECLLAGGRYTRLEKTRKATTVEGVRRVLNVCNHPPAGGRNCSACYKCLRTLATLDLMGVLQEFAGVFDLEVYRRRRFEYLAMLPARLDDPLIREIYEFSQSPAARLPRHVALLHAVAPLYAVPYRAARSIARRRTGAGEKPV